MSYIQVINECKRYKMGESTIVANNNINFEIEKGEFVIILGPSGAGKSTVLNILGGMDSCDEGQIIIDGVDISKYNSKQLTKYRRNDVGFVFQFYNLMNNLSAYENVNIAASIVNNPLSTSKLLENVGLTKRMKNFPSQLSGGEQQRVSIARAIVKNPKLLLCDEPTGALDSKTGKEIIKLLLSLCEEYQTTIVVVTHNSNLAELGTRLIRIGDGKIIENKKIENRKKVDDIVW